MPRISRTKPSTTSQTVTRDAFNTAIYARLSSEDCKEVNSLENQIYMVEKHIEERQDLKHCGTFTDNGETGTNFNRDGFTHMMDEVRRGNINCIVVKDLSRFGRNYIETGEYLEKILPFMGVRFISVNDGLDSEDANSTDALIISLKNLVNDVYAKDISQKISSALRIRQEQGDFIGGLPPYGYLKSSENHRKLVVDDEVAHIVRDVFDWKADGLGDVAIARRLNELGIPSPMRRWVDKGWVKRTGGTKVFLWRDKTIQLMTTNPVYIGHMAQGKFKQSICDSVSRHATTRTEWIVVENTHEAIIDVATFDKAQEMRSKNTSAFYKNYDRSKHIKNGQHLFKGMLLCGNCGSKIVRRKIRENKHEVIYSFVCPVERGKLGVACNVGSFREDDLSSVVFSLVKAQVEIVVDENALAQKIADKKGRNGQDTTKQIFDLQQEIKRLSNLRAKLFETFADKLLTEDEYVVSKNNYTQKINSIKESLSTIERDNAIASTIQAQTAKLKQTLDSLIQQGKLSAEMVQALICSITIHSGDRLEICWNFSDMSGGAV